MVKPFDKKSFTISWLSLWAANIKGETNLLYRTWLVSCSEDTLLGLAGRLSESFTKASSALTHSTESLATACNKAFPTSAPFSRRNSAISWWSLLTASCRAVSPDKFAQFTSTCFSSAYKRTPLVSPSRTASRNLLCSSLSVMSSKCESVRSSRVTVVRYGSETALILGWLKITTSTCASVEQS